MAVAGPGQPDVPKQTGTAMRMTMPQAINATEFNGVNTTYEARIHVFEELLWRERQHLHRLLQTAIKANLDERQLAQQQQMIDYTYGLVQRVATALGHDTADPEVRRIIGRQFEHELGEVSA